MEEELQETTMINNGKEKTEEGGDEAINPVVLAIGATNNTSLDPQIRNRAIDCLADTLAALLESHPSRTTNEVDTLHGPKPFQKRYLEPYEGRENVYDRVHNYNVGVSLGAERMVTRSAMLDRKKKKKKKEKKEKKRKSGRRRRWQP